jgi:hypothetical protein
MRDPQNAGLLSKASPSANQAVAGVHSASLTIMPPLPAAGCFGERTDQGMLGEGFFQALDMFESCRNLAAIISGRKNEGQAFRLKGARKIERVAIAKVNIHERNVDGVRTDELAGIQQIVCGTNNGGAIVGYAGDNAVALNMVILRHQHMEAIKSFLAGFVEHSRPPRGKGISTPDVEIRH